MLRRYWQDLLAHLDGVPWGIVINAYLIIAIGIFNLYSATGADTSGTRFYDQLNFLALGTFSMVMVGVVFDLRTIERWTILGYVMICALLVAVDVFGHTSKGAQRWLAIGPVRIQPSEFTKFIIILIVARSFAFTKGMTEFSLLSLWRQAILIAIPTVLILVQPDLGTASLVGMIAGMQLAFCRIRLKSILAVAGIALCAIAVSWSFLLYDYQKQRVVNFLNPMLDKRGSSYQLLQSMIAVGSGGLTGKGYRQGTQSQLSFLPERHTDFIFSVWAEEHGFVGCVFLLFLFLLLIVQLLRVAERAKDLFSSLVAIGVAAFFLFHFVINVTMVVGLFPVVGVPLTLVSYGGSHLLTALSCLGLIIAVERRRTVSVTS